MKKDIIIATHSGTFHTDDCFAVALLILYLRKEIDEVKIVRSRNASDLASAQFVVDVGGIYDEQKNLFDHHQEGGAGVREDGIPYAAFGLVWKKFGEEIAGSKEVKDKFEEVLVEPVDAHDNGVSISSPIFERIFPFS